MRGLRSRMAIAGVAWLSLLGCGGTGGEDSAPPKAAEPRPVQVETVTASARTLRIPLTGTVEAARRVEAASKILSHVVEAAVREGDRVRAGQTLIVLDDREPRAGLEAARAAQAEADEAAVGAEQAIVAARAELELARATHGRFKDLLDKESVSRQEFDQTLARLQATEARVRQAEAGKAQAESRRTRMQAGIASAETMLGHTRIASPLSGLVTRRLVDPGDLAAPGVPLIEIEQSRGYRLEVAVPESQAARLRRGMELAVRIDALGPDSPSTAKVVEIVPVSAPGSRSLLVKLELPASSGLRSGLYGEAYLLGEDTETLTVDAQAVVERGQIRSVFIVDRGAEEGAIARRRLVALGDQHDGRFTVLSGLEAGDLAVLNPAGVDDGAAVLVAGGLQ